MLMTSDERRKIVTRLREHQYSDVRYPTIEGGIIASWLRLKEALGVEGDDPQEDHTMMFGYLADLIEPEPERTCRYRHIVGEWYASECGDRYSGVVPPNFCPNCGAKVVPS